VLNNRLYILGGFNINVASTNEIWEFDPTVGIGAKWTQKVNTPEGIMYAPTCAIDGIIYVGGASDFDTVAAAVIDTTNSFSFDPGANTIGTIAAIPRATGETRALTFNGQMYVMGGGRVAPNPSNEVDIYDPGTNTWTIGDPFVNGRRNFPTDTDGTSRIWLVGGYDVTGVPVASMEIFCAAGGPTPSPTPTPTVTPPVTPTPTVTPTVTPSVTPSATPTPSTTPPPTATPRVTPRPRPTPFPRPTP
jgi:Kelch motif